MRPEASAHSETTERESCSSAAGSTSGHVYAATKIPEELYLSNFQPSHFSWTRSLNDIVKVLEAERSLSLDAMHTLVIQHEAIAYEDFVEDVLGHAKRLASFLDVECEPAMLHPEDNK